MNLRVTPEIRDWLARHGGGRLVHDVLEDLRSHAVCEVAMIIERTSIIEGIGEIKLLSELGEWILVGMTAGAADAIIQELRCRGATVRRAQKGVYEGRYEVLADGGPVRRQHRAPIQKESAASFVEELYDDGAAGRPGIADLDDVRLDQASLQHPEFEKQWIFWGVGPGGDKHRYHVTSATSIATLRACAQMSETVEDFGLAIRRAAGAEGMRMTHHA